MGVMVNREHQSDFPGPDEHPRLAAELRGLARKRPAPADLDGRVLGELDLARRPIAWGRGLAVAALIAIAIGVLSVLLVPQAADRTMSMPSVMSEAAVNPWDVTADGQVDVLDAFALAKAIERGHAGGEADFNIDGQVDAGDLALLTARIVRVETGKDTGS